ncbi:MAG TPA: hypothetical protein PK776_03820 [Flavobacterium sp.]|nr:hypothetical protein [Flavobacterium sp.]
MRKIYYIILSFLLVVILTTNLSCRNSQSKKKFKFNTEIINRISNETTDLPSSFSSIFFFGKCTSGNVALLKVQDLKGLHKIKYPNLDFYTFLEKALNQEIVVDYKDKVKCFEFDKSISSIYEKNDFNTFLELTCEKISGDKYTLKENINNGQINTVLYYCFINNYLTVFDDYIGKFYIDKDVSYIK